MLAHLVVDTPAGKDDFRVVADLLRLVRQVVRIDADAVATNQPRSKGQEVPFCARRQQHILGVDAEAMEDQRQFVDEGDVQITLGIFDHLRRLGDTNAGRPVCTRGDDRGIELIHIGGSSFGGTRRNLGDTGQAVQLVAGVDPFRAVAGKEVPVEGQTGATLQFRHADLFRRPGVDRRFVDDDVPPFQHLADGPARRQQRAHVGTFVFIDRRGHRDDVGVAVVEGCQVTRQRQLRGGGQFFGGDLQRRIVAGAQRGNSRRVDVEPCRGVVPAEFNGQWQADISQAEDGDAGLGNRCQYVHIVLVGFHRLRISSDQSRHGSRLVRSVTSGSGSDAGVFMKP